SEDLEISTNTIVGSAKNGAFVSRLDFQFTTSRYDTFKEKMRSLKGKQSITSTDSYLGFSEAIANVGRITRFMDEYETFGVEDMLGNIYTDNKPLVQYKAMLNDTYYKNDIHPLVYEEYPLDGDIRVKRDVDILGMPPRKSFQLSTAYVNYAQTGA